MFKFNRVVIHSEYLEINAGQSDKESEDYILKFSQRLKINPIGIVRTIAKHMALHHNNLSQRKCNGSTLVNKYKWSDKEYLSNLYTLWQNLNNSGRIGEDGIFELINNSSGETITNNDSRSAFSAALFNKNGSKNSDLALYWLGDYKTIKVNLCSDLKKKCCVPYREQNSGSEKWNVDLHVNGGQIIQQKHYSYESWYQKITIDKDGNATHSVDSIIINTGQKLLNSIKFPIYCDANDILEEEIKPWAYLENKSLSIMCDNWIPERSRGKLFVELDPPIPPGDCLQFNWGYTMPGTFKPGDEYYNWDISTKHFKIGGELKFHSSWRILYLNWDGDIEKSQPAAEWNQSSIKWKIHFPDIGNRITMRFGLHQDKSI